MSRLIESLKVDRQGTGKRAMHGVTMHAFLSTCGGFLCAVLWFDLMFDVQVLGHPDGTPLPAAVLNSIGAYYRRVTTEADPMGRLVGVVMAATLIGVVWSLVRGRKRSGAPRREHRLDWLALLLVLAAVGLAGGRVLPNAITLGQGLGTIAEQGDLARSILADHLFCLGAIFVFVVLQLRLAAAANRSSRDFQGQAGPRARVAAVSGSSPARASPSRRAWHQQRRSDTEKGRARAAPARPLTQRIKPAPDTTKTGLHQPSSIKGDIQWAQGFSWHRFHKPIWRAFRALLPDCARPSRAARAAR